MIELRPYQRELVAKVRDHKRPLVVLPTGAGKTMVASEIIRQAENKHVLFLAHRRELVHQAQNKLAEFGVAAGVILAGHPINSMRRVQVASVQTLWARYVRGDRDLPPAEILFIDEAHHCPARTYRTVIERYPDAQIVGMTATPCRRDGRGLGNVFDALIEGPQVQQLIDLAYLVRTKVFAPSKPDLEGVRTRHGDYVEAQLAERVDKPKLVGEIVTHWHRLAQRRKTVVFATSVAHSIHLRDEFRKTGVRAEHIDGKTPKTERDEILRRLSAGDLELVTNCMVLTEGWDQPDVGCAVLARPTKSLGLFRQMVGRVLRPAPGKPFALILDHAGAVFQHGFVEDPITWTLDETTCANNPAQAKREIRASSRLLECSQCAAIRTAGEPCPHCGFKPRPPGEYIQVGPGELAEFDRDGKHHPLHYTRHERVAFYRGLLKLALDRGNKPAAAAWRYKDRFGEFPPRSWIDLGPAQPSPEVFAWDRHCRIRYAKAMEKTRRYG